MRVWGWVSRGGVGVGVGLTRGGWGGTDLDPVDGLPVPVVEVLPGLRPLRARPARPHLIHSEFHTIGARVWG